MIMTGHAAELPFELRSRPDELHERLLEDVARGLTDEAGPWLPTRLMYLGQSGSLYGDVARDPRYRLARRERALLARHACTIIDLTAPDHVIELGGGVSDKLPMLLRHCSAERLHVTAVDIDGEGLSSALRDLSTSLRRQLHVDAVIGDLERDLDPLPRHGRRLVALLGSTIGNFDDPARMQLLETVARSSETGDALLLGVDLNQRGADQAAAYSIDSVARFNLAAADTLAELTGGDFSAADFTHRASWRTERSALAVDLVPQRDLEVPLHDGTTARLRAGVPITTAVSRKFDVGSLDANLAVAGFERTTWWFNDTFTHGLVLATRA